MAGSSHPALNIVLRNLGPRFQSLQLPGSSLLLLDIIHACNTVLNSADMSQSTPRMEAVSMLANLLSLPESVIDMLVLQPDPIIQVLACPSIKVRC